MALNYMIKARGLDDPLENSISTCGYSAAFDSLATPSSSGFFILNGSSQFDNCNCPHCDESIDRFSEWSVYAENELIAQTLRQNLTLTFTVRDLPTQITTGRIDYNHPGK